VPFEAPPAAPSSGARNGQEFDPGEIARQRNIWWLNRSCRYFLPKDDGSQWLEVSERTIKRELRLANVSSRASDLNSFSQADQVMHYVENHHDVDFAGPLAGKKAGVYNEHGRPFVVLGSYTLIEPKEGDWPILRTVLDGMLGGEQSLYLFAWLKVAIIALRNGARRAAPALILAGPVNSGKSLLQEYVITPLLGDRHADPSAFMLGKTAFNADLMGSEHLCIEELKSGLDGESRAFLAESIKKFCVTEAHSYHAKGADALTMYPFWRVTISVNSDPDRLKSLPPLREHIKDKIILLRTERRPMPMPTITDKERLAFSSTIKKELPAFIHFLLNWEIPGKLLRTGEAARYGYDVYHHPDLTADLFEHEPESGLLYIIDKEIFKDGSIAEPWGWESAMKLHELLTSSDCLFANQARKLFGYTGAAGSMLAKLAEKYPRRFGKRHTASGNRWLIRPPLPLD
jgi:hypothetical protein